MDAILCPIMGHRRVSDEQGGGLVGGSGNEEEQKARKQTNNSRMRRGGEDKEPVMKNDKNPGRGQLVQGQL